MVSYLKGKRAKEGASDARSPPRARPTPSGPSSPTITKLSSMSRRVITSAGASLLAGAGMNGSAAAAAKKGARLAGGRCVGMARLRVGVWGL